MPVLFNNVVVLEHQLVCNLHVYVQVGIVWTVVTHAIGMHLTQHNSHTSCVVHTPTLTYNVVNGLLSLLLVCIYELYIPVLVCVGVSVRFTFLLSLHCSNELSSNI